MRDVALLLEGEQRSPPEPVLLDLAALSQQTGAACRDVIQALDDLSKLSLIDGPGEFTDTWLFRKFTRKGQVFIDEVRDPSRWSLIKRSYGFAGEKS